MQVYIGIGLCETFVTYGRSTRCSLSLSLLIAHISLILPGLFDTSSKGHGSNLWVTSPQMPCSIPLTESWRQSAPESKSNLPMWLSINYFLWPTYFDKPFILCYIYGFIWQFLSFMVVGLQKKRSNKSFSSILTTFHQEIITFAT